MLDYKIDIGTMLAITDLEHLTGLGDLRLATRVILI